VEGSGRIRVLKRKGLERRVKEERILIRGLRKKDLDRREEGRKVLIGGF